MGAFGIGGGVTNLSAVTATGTGVMIPAARASGSTWSVKAATVTAGGTVLVEGSLNNADWYTVATLAVTATGNKYIKVDEPHPFLRANLSARTDGTYTVQCALWDGAR